MRQYVVDAFADRIFEGNPAAVCVMERWPEEDLMLKITRENNLSETAFVVKEGESTGCAGSPPAGRSTYAATPPWPRPISSPDSWSREWRGSDSRPSADC